MFLVSASSKERVKTCRVGESLAAMVKLFHIFNSGWQKEAFIAVDFTVWNIENCLAVMITYA